VGYGDRFPVTTEGRAIAVILMFAGVGLFGTFSGFLASWFIGGTQTDQKSEIALLREEIRELLVIRRAKTGQSSAPKTGHRVGGIGWKNRLVRTCLQGA
jgi:voltage-gated potassium channel